MSRTRHLPRELIDTIIDYYHADESTLLVCSLVCRDWVSATRFHLFSCVDISAQTAARFVGLLKSPHCTLTRYLHGLRMHAAAPQWIVPSFITAIVDARLVVTTLHLDFRSHHQGSDTIIELLPPTFPHVTHFSLHNSHQRNNEAFIRFLCGLENLESLELVNLDDNPSIKLGVLDVISKLRDGPNSQLQLSSTLSTLHLRGGDHGNTLEALHRLQPRPKLSKLTINGPSTRPNTEDLERILGYLYDNRTTLRHLQLVGGITAFDLIIMLLAPTFPHITHFSLHHSYQQYNERLILFLCGLKKLESIELVDIGDDGRNDQWGVLDVVSELRDGPNPQPQLASALRTLHLASDDCGSILEALHRLQPRSKLSTCTINVPLTPNTRDLKRIHAYVYDNHTTLHHLKLVGAINEFNLHPLSELRTIDFSDSVSCNQAITGVYGVLRTVTSPFVQELSIHTWSYPSDPGWSDLDALLASPPFTSIQTLNMTFSTHETGYALVKDTVELDDASRSELEANFPRFIRRGILRAVFADDHAEWVPYDELGYSHL